MSLHAALPADIRIVAVEYAPLVGQRPRVVGCNAIKGVHGETSIQHTTVVRASSGACGIGRGRPTLEQAAGWIGQPVRDCFAADGTLPEYRPVEMALWDLAGKLLERPVYALLGGTARPIPGYDSSIYIDDLECASDGEASDLIAREIQDGLAAGYRAFKMKIGRGHQWMEAEAGFTRDVAAIRRARAEVGPDVPLMLDANNGMTPEIAQRLLEAVGDCNLFWFEEPFPETPAACEAFRQWMRDQGFRTYLADGESGWGGKTPEMEAFALGGHVDVFQADMDAYGLTYWRGLAARLAAAGVLAAPHNWGSWFAVAPLCHLGASISNFCFAEVDRMTLPAVHTPGYRPAGEHGHLSIPDAPGFGINLDEAAWDGALQTGDAWIAGERRDGGRG